MGGSQLLIGIDEAGYGPLLGPLVVSASCLEVTSEWLEKSAWVMLKASVSATPGARSRKLAICDSKKLHKPTEGITRLERSAFTAISAALGAPANLCCLLEMLCPHVVQELKQHPWYGGAGISLPRKADPGGAAIAARLFGQDIADHNGKLLGMWSEVLLEQEFNRMVAGTRNKAVVLLGLTTRLIHRIAQAHPGRNMRICIDKQGGRDFYGRALLRAFEDRHLKVIAEEDGHSEYELSDERSKWRISFDESGESRHMPIALSSIVSKYVRELLMECFNDFWLHHVPTIRPTAGYYTDGVRFLSEIQPHFERLGIDRGRLIRQR